MTTKRRIYNPKTKTYYVTRQRSTSKGKKGTIRGKWKPPKKTTKKKANK